MSSIVASASSAITPVLSSASDMAVRVFSVYENAADQHRIGKRKRREKEGGRKVERQAE